MVRCNLPSTVDSKQTKRPGEFGD